MLSDVVPMPLHDPAASPEADMLARTFIESGASDLNVFHQHFGKGETALQQSFGHHFATGLSDYASTAIAQEGEAVFDKTLTRFVQGVSELPLDLYTHALRTLKMQLSAKSEECSTKDYASLGRGEEGYTLTIAASQRIAHLLSDHASFSIERAAAMVSGLTSAPPVARAPLYKKNDISRPHKRSL